MTDDLLGKTIRNVDTGEVGTVRSVHALDLDGSPAVFVEVPVVREGKQHPHMNRVWNVKVVEVVE